MKKLILGITAFAFLGMVAYAAVSFPDVSTDDWFYDGVQYVADNGIMTGYPNGDFGPQDKVNRAQLATVLMRLDAAKIDSLYTDMQYKRGHDVQELTGSSWGKYKSELYRFPVEGVKAILVDSEYSSVLYSEVKNDLKSIKMDGSYYNNFEILSTSKNSDWFFISETAEGFGVHVYGPFYDDISRLAGEIGNSPTI